MPGKNALFNLSQRPWHDRYLRSKVHVVTVLVVLSIEVAGIVRFYLIFEDLRYTVECLAISFFLLMTDIMCFSGMYMAKYADPGYLVPGQDRDTIELECLDDQGAVVGSELDKQE